ncbi:NAD-dependent epimerase/dehydratase family protein [Paraflavisolibacter sp. H34]|uniref:NAD-dependent epimerase/dehydratase family protein n=1 Tax=Huijunlia imazamoxiresistens TaxID=3127457 RepID=UPI003019FC5B
MQTILGAGGAVGTELAKCLTAYTGRIRLVGRQPRKINETDELFPADLLQAAEVHRAVAGSEVAYLTAGLLYKTGYWQKNWPVLMQNVLAACRAHGTRLVFFDNIYMYSPHHLHRMTEHTPVRPASKKGAVRHQVAGMLQEEVAAGRLNALIARSADFIGVKNSALTETVALNLLKGKKAVWLVDADKAHTFTFVPDAAAATALLGNTPEAINQVWHLPTDPTPLTGRQWVELFARELGVRPQVQVISRGMLSPLGLFLPILKELKEMAYQYDRDYIFDSSKFTRTFGYRPATPQESVRAVVEGLSAKRYESRT